MSADDPDPNVTLQILVYDLSSEELAAQQGVAPGFYYTFPLDDDAGSDALIVAGPHESIEAAQEAALKFAIDALTDQTTDLQEESDDAVSER